MCVGLFFKAEEPSDSHHFMLHVWLQFGFSSLNLLQVYITDVYAVSKMCMLQYKNSYNDLVIAH